MTQDSYIFRKGRESEVSIDGNAWGLLSQRFLLGDLFFLFRKPAVKD